MFAIFRKMQFSTRAWNINNFRLSSVFHATILAWALTFDPRLNQYWSKWVFREILFYSSGPEFFEWNTLDSRVDREIVKLLATFHPAYLRSRCVEARPGSLRTRIARPMFVLRICKPDTNRIRKYEILQVNNEFTRNTSCLNW